MSVSCGGHRTSLLSPTSDWDVSIRSFGWGELRVFNCFLGRYAVSKVLSAKPLFVAMCPKSQGLLIP